MYIYRFVDEQLYSILILFETDYFGSVCVALREKYGTPISERKRPTSLTWSNGTSGIFLNRGKLNPRESSVLTLLHYDLESIVDSRSPKASDDL